MVLLRRISNFTDFNVLERDERFHLYYTNNVEEIRKADIIILPGSKNTIADLINIRANGIADAVVQAYKAGKKVIGICGGYQMMGLRIEDPDQMEGEVGTVPGLGLFPLVTVMEKEKTTCQSRFRYKGGEEWCEGYQIHMGKTEEVGKEGREITRSLNILDTGEKDGYYLDDRCWGSYMHGILDHASVLNDLAAGLTQERCENFDYMAFKQQQYDKLARQVRAAVDMEYIYSTLRENAGN